MGFTAPHPKSLSIAIPRQKAGLFDCIAAVSLHYGEGLSYRRV
jgi:hypothetical protein